MTTSKTTPSQPTGLIPIEVMRTDDPSVIVFKNIYCIPVWREEEIAWFDIYSLKNGLYLGKKSSLEEVKEKDND